MWRRGKGFKRHIIGTLKSGVSSGSGSGSGVDGPATFEYNENNIKEAFKEGIEKYPNFNGVALYPGFGLFQKYIGDGVIEAFAKRLISRDRKDRNEYLRFWDINEEVDDFNMLALTQAKSPTDEFEFLGVYDYKKGDSFITDLAGVSYGDVSDPDLLKKGDILDYEFETDNQYDKNAVVVRFNGIKIGYVKVVHNMIFNRSRKKDKKLKLSVWDIDRNGVLKNVFIKIECI